MGGAPTQKGRVVRMMPRGSRASSSSEDFPCIPILVAQRGESLIFHLILLLEEVQSILVLLGYLCPVLRHPCCRPSTARGTWCLWRETEMVPGTSWHSSSCTSTQGWKPP